MNQLSNLEFLNYNNSNLEKFNIDNVLNSKDLIEALSKKARRSGKRTGLLSYTWYDN